MNINKSMSANQMVVLILCLTFYAASVAYVIIMDVWVLSANQMNWADLQFEDRCWIMGPMLGLQATGLIILISNVVEEANRNMFNSCYTGNKYDWM